MPIFTPRLVPRRCVALRVWSSLRALVGKINRPTFRRRYETPELTNFAEARYRARQRHEARLSFLDRAADILLEAHNGGPLAAVPTLPTEDEPSTPNGLDKLAGRLHHETIGGLADMATWKKEAGARFRGDFGRRRRKLRGADSVDCRRPCRPWARLCCDVSALLLAYIIRLHSGTHTIISCWLRHHTIHHHQHLCLFTAESKIHQFILPLNIEPHQPSDSWRRHGPSEKDI